MQTPFINRIRIASTLAWRREGTGWLLLAGRRRLGRVIADSKYPAMFRSALSSGRLSDLANVNWAKSAVLEAAVREIEWEVRRSAATPPSKMPSKWGCFRGVGPTNRAAAGGGYLVPREAAE